MTGTSIKRLDEERSGPLAVLKKPLAMITPALRFAKQLSHETNSSFGHRADMVPYCTRQRARHLGEFARADAAEQILFEATQMQPLDRKVAGAMVSGLLGVFGAKPDMAVLDGMLDALEADELAIVWELAGGFDDTARWQPVHASPVTLALACRKLIATAKFPPRPAELRAACAEAGYVVGCAMKAAEGLVDHVRRCDAVTLEFARDEWKQPFLTPAFRPILPRMLELHSIHGDGSDAWHGRDEDATHPFMDLVNAETDKLALPMRQAACATSLAKRVRKPRRTPS